MEKIFALKKDHQGLLYDDMLELSDEKDMQTLANPARLKILKALTKEDLYPAEIAKRLQMHEQKVYYHVRMLLKAGMIQEKTRKEVRGTVAKSLGARHTNFMLSLKKRWRPLKELTEKDPARELLQPFMREGMLDCKIVVGSPDPHGPFKARARDGHYATDLGIFLGNQASLSADFGVNLDVDVDLKTETKSLIVVGGPVTNLITSQINAHIPAKFSDREPWGIAGKKTHVEDSCGLIARIPNPYKPDRSILLFAGIRGIGTKTSVMGFTRHTALTLKRFTGQKRFYCILQGFDLDGDGRIDDVELLE